MARSLLLVLLLLALQACSTAPASASDSACAANPASYACQIEAYQRAP